MTDAKALADYSTLEEVAGSIGNSFHVAWRDRLISNLDRLLQAFRLRWPGTTIGYSYKTNYLSSFIEAADSWGAWSEVVSEGEFDFARSLGVRSDHIIVNGPVKSSLFLSRVLGSAARIHMDSLDELATAASIARSAGTTMDIGLRCDLGEPTLGTRFGIATWDSQLPRQVSAVGDCLRLTSLHVHHSGPRGAERFATRAEQLARVHADVFPDHPISMLDLGGGFGSELSAELARQIGQSPSYDAYAEAVVQGLRRVYGEGKGPDLVLEPGMGILADTMSFVTRIVSCKTDGGRAIAVVDGSFFSTLPLQGRVELPVQVVKAAGRRNGRVHSWRVVGATCMEIDVLRSALPADLAVGDFLVFSNVGAYSTSLTPVFITPVPPVVDGSSLPGVRLLSPAVPLTSRHGPKT